MKKRIVGAAVLISLLVILLPLALKGPVQDHVEEVPLTLPPPPFEKIEKPTRTEERVSTTTVSHAPTPLELKELPPSSTSEQRAPETSEVTEVSKGDVKEPLKVTAKKEPLSDTPPLSPTKSVPDLSPKVIERSTLHSGWVIQVGSFSSLSKAEALQRALEKSDIETTVTQITIGSKLYHRVRVIPPRDKAEAEIEAERLRQSHKLDTLLVRFEG